MKKIVWLWLLVFAFSSSVAAQEGLSKDQIREIANSVVQIVTLKDGKPFSTGSGTIVSANGIIFTNRHVVEGGTDYAILMLEDMREAPVHRYFASLVGTLGGFDFAVLRIDRDDSGATINTDRLNLPFLKVSDQTDIDHGERVYIFGFPGIGDGYLVLTQGTITTIENGTVGGKRLPVWYQTDAEISPGNSGGLVVNSSGEYVGIPTAVQSEGRTLGRLGGILPIVAVAAALEAGEDAGQQVEPTPAPVLSGGLNITCDRGLQIVNGVAITVRQMRAGFTYKATAIGINGFDPVMAVYDPNTMRGQCTDDSREAMNYAVRLPTTGDVVGTRSGAQISFSQTSGQGMADVSLVVGSADGTPGEFVLILEGMAATERDGKGDPFSVGITPGMVGSGVPLSVYMISVTDALDSFIYLGDQNLDIFTFDDGTQLYCDDAGTNDCWGDSVDLSRSSVTRSQGRALPGGPYDAMLSIPLDGLDVSESNPLTFTFLMTSYQQTSFGDYVAVFHAASQ